MKQAPATLVDRVLLGPPRHHRAPVRRLVIDVQPAFGQHVGADIGQRLQDRKVGWRHQHHLFALVAGIQDRLLRRRVVARSLEHLEPGVVRHRRSRTEDAGRHMEHGGIVAHHRLHVVGLADRLQQSATDRRVVERRIEVIQSHARDLAGRVLGENVDVGVLLEQRHEVLRRVLPPIHLVVLQRARRRRGIGDHVPLDAVEVDDLGSGRPVRRATLARLVVSEPVVDHLRSHNPFLRVEPEWPAADHLGHLRERVRPGQPLRHHGGEVAGRLAERVRQQRERRLQAELDGLVVGRRQLVGKRQQRLPIRVPLAPALDRGHAIPRQHRASVMEFQPVAQRDPHQLAVVLDRHAVGHLRRGHELTVQGEQRVEHHVAVIARHVGGGPDRIEHGQVRLRHELQHPRPLGRDDAGGCERGGTGGQQSPALDHELSVLFTKRCQGARRGTRPVLGRPEQPRPFRPHPPFLAIAPGQADGHQQRGE